MVCWHVGADYHRAGERRGVDASGGTVGLQYVRHLFRRFIAHDPFTPARLAAGPGVPSGASAGVAGGTPPGAVDLVDRYLHCRTVQRIPALPGRNAGEIRQPTHSRRLPDVADPAHAGPHARDRRGNGLPGTVASRTSPPAQAAGAHPGGRPDIRSVSPGHFPDHPNGLPGYGANRRGRAHGFDPSVHPAPRRQQRLRLPALPFWYRSRKLAPGTAPVEHPRFCVRDLSAVSISNALSWPVALP